jgi:hypothetical protein
MLSALESILLKNSNEPIQQNLSERLAVFTAQELAKRKSIISTPESVRTPPVFRFSPPGRARSGSGTALN